MLRSEFAIHNGIEIKKADTMWSNKYYYLNIFKDEMLSSDTDTKELRKFLSTIPELQQKGDFAFGNKEPFPFVDLLMLKAGGIYSWNDSNVNSENTNLITIVCAKGEHIDFEEMKKVFIQIASFLNWELVDEYTDDEIENFKLWGPSE